MWKKIFNKEEEMEMTSVVSFVLGQIIQCLGHVMLSSKNSK